mgnify:CR=1 FL=1
MNKVENLNEFSRFFNLDLVEKRATEEKIEASSEECHLLAKRFSIIEVVSLKASCVLNRRKQKEAGDFLLRVNMEAEIVQSCVMTLNNVHESIHENFSIIFQISAIKCDENDESKEVFFNIDDEDIEYIEDKEIDLGEYVAEYLSLYMNAYPRQSDVKGKELGYKILTEDDVSDEPKKENPFAVLEELKHNT